MLDAIVIKAVGAIAGAVFALVFIKPATWRELSSRAVGAPLAGIILAVPVRDHVLGWSPTDDATMAAAAISAAASWWVAGAAMRLLSAYGERKSSD